jgi:RNA recognition motif-containing protein
MGKKIFVGNLPWSATSDSLYELFQTYGQVRQAEVVMDRETGRSKGFGFVEMEVDSEALSAIEGLNGTPLEGRPLTVNEAKPREPRSGGGGGGRSGGGGGRSGYRR